MAKKGHSADGKYLNPPFDPRMLKIGPPSLGSHNLQRGRLVSAQKNSVTGKKHGVHFLYNPVALTASHNVDPFSTVNNSLAQSTTAAGQAGQFADIGGVSVDLLYDRTYELWDRGKKNTKAGRFGVYADVLAFYFILGITATSGGNVKTKNQNSTGGHVANEPGGGTETVAWQSLYPTSAMSNNELMWLYIGDKMRFYGLVTSFSITYSHWNQKMIPARCQVSLSMNFQTDPKANQNTIKRKYKKGSPADNIPGSGNP